MTSKAERIRGQLASFARDREKFEQQRKELEAEMSKGRANMEKIQRGVKQNEITSTITELDVTKKSGSGTSSANTSRKYGSSGTGFGAKSFRSESPANQSAPVLSLSQPGQNGSMVSSKDGTATPLATTNIFSSGLRTSDWSLSTSWNDSAPPTIKSNDIYETVRFLGRGSFGDVYLVKNVDDNKLFAMKTVFSEHEKDMTGLIRELNFLRMNRHPFIIDIYDGFIVQHTRILHIIMPYCESGDLGKVITSAKKNNSTIPENHIIKWTLQIALALHYLHERRVIHRDLKPCNIMLSEGGELVRLADFGLAIHLHEDDLCSSGTEAGTPLYTAPEIILGVPYSYPTDCWSFGVMLYELLALEPPFVKSSLSDLVKSILDDECPDIPAHYSSELKSMVRLFLSKLPAYRLGFAGMLLEPFLSTKLHSIASGYRPKVLEERVRRSHAKQLVAQIESLSQSVRSSTTSMSVLSQLHSQMTNAIVAFPSISGSGSLDGDNASAVLSNPFMLSRQGSEKVLLSSSQASSNKFSGENIASNDSNALSPSLMVQLTRGNSRLMTDYSIPENPGEDLLENSTKSALTSATSASDNNPTNTNNSNDNNNNNNNNISSPKGSKKILTESEVDVLASKLSSITEGNGNEMALPTEISSTDNGSLGSGSCGSSEHCKHHAPLTRKKSVVSVINASLMTSILGPGPWQDEIDQNPSISEFNTTSKNTGIESFALDADGVISVSSPLSTPKKIGTTPVKDSNRGSDGLEEGRASIQNIDSIGIDIRASATPEDPIKTANFLIAHRDNPNSRFHQEGGSNGTGSNVSPVMLNPSDKSSIPLLAIGSPFHTPTHHGGEKNMEHQLLSGGRKGQNIQEAILVDASLNQSLGNIP